MCSLDGHQDLNVTGSNRRLQACAQRRVSKIVNLDVRDSDLF